MSTPFFCIRATGMLIMQTLGGAKASAFWNNAGSTIAGCSITRTGATHAP